MTGGFEGLEAPLVIFHADLDFRQDMAMQGDGVQNAIDIILSRHILPDFSDIRLRVDEF